MAKIRQEKTNPKKNAAYTFRRKRKFNNNNNKETDFKASKSHSINLNENKFENKIIIYQ
jgi:hypothetical protein